MEKQHAELMCVYKKELNSKAKERMLAVLNVVDNGKTISIIAQLFCKSYNTIKNWVRFKEFGIAGLYEKPRSGRPTTLANHKLKNFLQVLKIITLQTDCAPNKKRHSAYSYTESAMRAILGITLHPVVPECVGWGNDNGFYVPKRLAHSLVFMIIMNHRFAILD